jgi:hypothetical protein
MYGLDQGYVTLAAFIGGCDAATRGRLLEGFSDWVAVRSFDMSRSSLAWWSLVAARELPDILEGSKTFRDLSEDQSAAACAELLKLLDEFLGERV